MSGVVGQEPPGWLDAVEQACRDGDVVDVACSQDEDARPTFPFRERMELAGAAATRLAERSLEVLPFPPLAERCADMGAVVRRQAVDAAMAGERLEDLEPQPLPAPAVEPVVDRRRLRLHSADMIRAGEKGRSLST
jgi:hypothetical protein